MIAGSGPQAIPPSTSNTQHAKRRSKLGTRKPLANKQKALMDKVLDVSTKMDDLRHFLTETSLRQR